MSEIILNLAFPSLRLDCEVTGDFCSITFKTHHWLVVVHREQSDWPIAHSFMKNKQTHKENNLCKPKYTNIRSQTVWAHTQCTQQNQQYRTTSSLQDMSPSYRDWPDFVQPIRVGSVAERLILILDRVSGWAVHLRHSGVNRSLHGYGFWRNTLFNVVRLHITMGYMSALQKHLHPLANCDRQMLRKLRFAWIWKNDQKVNGMWMKFLKKPFGGTCFLIKKQWWNLANFSKPWDLKNI